MSYQFRRLALLFLISVALASPTLAAFESEEMLSLKWRVNMGGKLEASSSINQLYVKDLDGDGFGEVILISAGSQTVGGVARNNGAFVFRDDGTPWWQQGTQEQLRTSFIGDLDKDMKQDLILTSGGLANNIQRGTIYVLDEEGNLDQKAHSTRMILSLEVADVDGDTWPDIIGGSTQQVSLFDKYGETQWDYLIGDEVRSVSAGSLDMEDDVQIIAGADKVYVLNKDGNLMGEIDLGSKIKYLTIANVTPSFGSEVIALTEKNEIVCVGIDEIKRGIGKEWKKFELNEKWKVSMGEGITSILVGNFDSDNADETLIGTEAGNLLLIDNTGFISWRKPKAALGDIVSLSVNDIDFDDTLEIVGGSLDKRIFVYDVKGNFEWTFDVREPVFSVEAFDLDENNFMDIIVVTNWKNVNVYELNKTFVKLQMAQMYFRRAQGNFTISKFNEAISNLNNAKRLFSELGDVAGLRECEKLGEQITEKIDYERKLEAESYHKKAQELYIEGNCKKALDYNNKALQIFIEMGDSESILKSELIQLRIDECLKLAPTSISTTIRDETDKPTIPGLSTNTLMLIGGVVFLIVFLGVVGKKLKKSREISDLEEGYETAKIEDNEWDEILNE
ncbi:MAG: VCBS repeat-containing protein [Candidatus Altiarchaeota archaeon]